MKKFIVFALVLLCFFSITPIHVLAVETTIVAGGETETADLQMLPIEVTAEMPGQKVEYTLPYPGMLPDHPLYFLKRLRDNILERLITDSIRKAEFYVLQGDKRLQMGVQLVANGKAQLGETTVSKAEKYLELAISGLKSHKQNGGMVPSYIIERLEKSTAKHNEVITDLMTKVTANEAKGLEGSKKLLTEIEAIIPTLK